MFKEVIQEHVHVTVTAALLIGIIVGMSLYMWRFDTKSAVCKQATVKERIITTEHVEDSLSKEVTYYLIECESNPYSGHKFRIQTDRDYPIGSSIKKTWVKDGK